MTKICGRCEIEKNVDRFYKKGDSWQSYCKDCNRQHKNEWIRSNRDKTQINRLWAVYRLRKEDFDNLLLLQDNKCALCKKDFSSTPVVDHDHSCCSGAVSCGKCVRGLLCDWCNKALGGYEYLVKLESLSKYLITSL